MCTSRGQQHQLSLGLPQRYANTKKTDDVTIWADTEISGGFRPVHPKRAKAHIIRAEKIYVLQAEFHFISYDRQESGGDKNEVE